MWHGGQRAGSAGSAPIVIGETAQEELLLAQRAPAAAGCEVLVPARVCASPAVSAVQARALSVASAMMQVSRARTGVQGHVWTARGAVCACHENLWGWNRNGSGGARANSLIRKARWAYCSGLDQYSHTTHLQHTALISCRSYAEQGRVLGQSSGASRVDVLLGDDEASAWQDLVSREPSWRLADDPRRGQVLARALQQVGLCRDEHSETVLEQGSCAMLEGTSAAGRRTPSSAPSA